MNDFTAHAASDDFAKIEGLLKAGLYISNTILVMEKDTGSKCTCNDESGYLVECYDKDDLSEYIEANHKGFGDNKTEEALSEQLANPNSAIYIIRSRSKIVSSVTVWDIDEECIATENIFTIPSYRKRHMASTILTNILNDAHDRGMKKARLNVYGDDNEAIAMYLRFGFKVIAVLQEFRA